MRLCRNLGHIKEALHLGRRFHVDIRPGDLTKWLFVLCGIERDLAWCEEDGSGVEGIRTVVSKLRTCHQPATEFYANLIALGEDFEFTPTHVKNLEKELDRIYY